MDNRLRKESIWISYIYGLPFGFVTTFLAFSIPVMLTGEGLATMALIAIYGKALIGLLISFILTLYIGALIIYQDNIKNRKLLWTSFKYSTLINVIIWTVFTIITVIDNLETDEWFIILIPIPIAFYICIILTQITLGLLIAYKVRRFKQSIM